MHLCKSQSWKRKSCTDARTRPSSQVHSTCEGNTRKSVKQTRAASRVCSKHPSEPLVRVHYERKSLTCDVEVMLLLSVVKPVA
eukprot:5848228-Pleurochrysis_carterae.AAC.1